MLMELWVNSFNNLRKGTQLRLNSHSTRGAPEILHLPNRNGELVTNARQGTKKDHISSFEKNRNKVI